jgi:hypothetical protein
VDSGYFSYPIGPIEFPKICFFQDNSLPSNEASLEAMIIFDILSNDFSFIISKDHLPGFDLVVVKYSLICILNVISLFFNSHTLKFLSN